MNNSIKVTMLFISTIVVSLAAWYTLTANLSAGIYPVSADSIGIPLFKTLAVLITILLLSFSAIAFTSFALFSRRYWLFIGVTLYSVSAFIAFLAGLSWWLPNHYVIAVSYYFLTLVLGLLAIIAVRTSNQSFKRDA